MRIVICGGGVIGTAIAFWLARRGAAPVVVESTGIACAASGKSGGFLALDWCDGTPLAALARRSFALHAALPDELGGDWGYRRLATFGGFAHGLGRAGAGRGAVGWLSDAVSGCQRLGSPETTAQIHPARFTAALMRAAEDRGAALRIGRVTGLLRQGERVAGVAVEGADDIEADAVVLALGPWSALAARWLGMPAVHGLKGHSVVLEAPLPPEAVFLEHQVAAGDLQSPELFPRPDGTVYACALSSGSPLPDDPAEVVPDAGAIERLTAICARLSPALAGAPVLAAQACFRPVTRDGLPLIGAVPGAPGAYVATGHSVWGMLNAPATGEAMAELLLDGAARAVDLSPFDPARLPPDRPAGRRGGAAR
jgi:glycine/D-amino acid oxidase-like deaminating enzyme